MKSLNEFKKVKNSLICIDSDGTAIDSMTSKHKLSFGPCFIKEWKLESRFDEVLDLWCKINLHGKTRGMNRFITLLMCLEELKSKGIVKDDLTALKTWVDTTDKLSNDRLLKAIEKSNADILKKAYSWSCATNASINSLSFEDKKAFDGVKEFLQFAFDKADIAIVSSANASSVKEEWDYFGLSQYVSVMTSQEQGTKKDCINSLLALGYDKNCVLMVGDAPPDYDSATTCGVHFYPILTDRETQSWKDLKDTYFKYLLDGNFNQIELELIDKFLQN